MIAGHASRRACLLFYFIYFLFLFLKTPSVEPSDLPASSLISYKETCRESFLSLPQRRNAQACNIYCLCVWGEKKRKEKKRTIMIMIIMIIIVIVKAPNPSFHRLSGNQDDHSPRNLAKCSAMQCHAERQKERKNLAVQKHPKKSLGHQIVVVVFVSFSSLLFRLRFPHPKKNKSRILFPLLPFHITGRPPQTPSPAFRERPSPTPLLKTCPAHSRNVFPPRAPSPSPADSPPPP